MTMIDGVFQQHFYSLPNIHFVTHLTDRVSFVIHNRHPDMPEVITSLVSSTLRGSEYVGVCVLWVQCVYVYVVHVVCRA